MSGFPRDEYTPHGLLANPAAMAHSWSEGSGGVLRTTRDPSCVGVGWVYPWALGAEAGAELRVTIRDGAALQIHAAHHSARLFEFGWHARGYRWRARYTLIAPDELGVELAADRAVELPTGDGAERSIGAGVGARQSDATGVQVDIEAWGWGAASKENDAGAAPSASRAGATAGSEGVGEWRVGRIDLGARYGGHSLHVAPSEARAERSRHSIDVDTGEGHEASPARRAVTVAARLVLPLSHESGVVLRAILRRERHDGTDATNAMGETSGEATDMLSGQDAAVATGLDARASGEAGGSKTDAGAAIRPGIGVGGRVAAAVMRARAEDDDLWSGGARLTGDWPASWRRGWVYDLETTRMCVMPAGGIFTDVWPSWMVQWPRAVVAEGTLDMVRLTYLSPDLAKRAVLSLFRDAPAPNVPCVFRHGEPNMVAKDGAVCGTSPAWCVPFYNLERLYLLTLDDRWLASLYPYLVAYLDWWLAERTDRDGWAVYKCTWEAGEDDTPRLDPERRGDNVVSELVRPVELQATMALSAAVLERFAGALERADDAARWRAVADGYAAKTATHWDAEVGRFRDWDARRGRFLEPAAETNYWGIDPLRYSALAFTPVLAGLADAEQLAALAREAERYDCPPWTLWASWSYVILETATVAGWRAFAARVAAGIVGRVYPELDRRTVEGNEPTPGAAREYWPLELSEWRSCDGYGWGATTASFLARQVFGFLEGGYSLDEPLAFRLAPGLPDDLCVSGRRYGLSNVPYRGALLDLAYVVGESPHAEGRQRGPAPDGRGDREHGDGGAHYGAGTPSEYAFAPDVSSLAETVALTAVVAARSASGEPLVGACVISDESGSVVYRSPTASAEHRFSVRRYARYEVALEPGPVRELGTAQAEHSASAADC